MKRIYIAPSTDLIEVKMTSMMSSSMDYVHNEEADTGTEDNPTNFSRRDKWGDCWAEEEEEEEE